MKLCIGTRGSKLALIQTNGIIDTLKLYYPECCFEVKIIKTKGDKIQHLALDKIGDKGLFVKEIEEQLLNGSIDMAVHSMKDMPSEVTKGLKFTKVPKREDRRDALVLKEKISDLSQLKEGAIIGTGSKRRKYQLLKIRPDLQVVPIRGNIDTRIKKIEDEGLDGIVLAAAGLIRAGLEDKISYVLTEDEVVPAPAQGALGLQIREDDRVLEEMLEKIASDKDHLEVVAERAFLKGVNGGCHIPVGASAKIEREQLRLVALYGDEEGKLLIKQEAKAYCYSVEDAVKIGSRLAESMMKGDSDEVR